MSTLPTLKRVLATGPKTAKIAIVGEATGTEEAIQNEPLVGSTGRLLSSYLAGAKVNRLDCYITNLCKVQPPDNKFDRLGELGITFESLQAELKEELSQVESNVIIALGAQALKALTGLTEITKWRGSILESTLLPGRKVIPAFHPAYIIRGSIQDSFFLMVDIQRAVRESAYPDFRSIPQRKFILSPTFDQAIEALDFMATWPYVSLDIENIPQTDVITEVGLGDHAYGEKGHFVITIPFFKGGSPVWSPSQEVDLWKRIRHICTSPTVYKIIQNASHELTTMFDWIGEIYPIFMDTMVGQHLCYSEQPKGLDTISSVYTTEPYYKEFKDRPDYNAKDVAVTYEAAMVMEKDELPAAKLVDFCHGFQMPFYSIMWQASMRGIKVDEERRLDLYKRTEDELAQAEKDLQTLVGYPLNVNSPKQVQKYLYSECKFPAQRKKGKLSADEEAINKLFLKFPNHVALKLILAMREKSKALSTYLSNKAIDPDGRIRTSWVITGTETGRLSSRQNTWGRGCNMQNIPKAVRDMFIADEGFTFVVGDLSQVEARFVAWLSGDPTYKAMFKSGKDIHKQVAGWIFRKDPEAVMPSERQRAKASAHGAPYGMTHKKVAALYGLGEEEAKWLIEQYFNMFPMVRSAYQAGIREQLSLTRCLTTPYGRRRIFFGYWGEDLFREAYASSPQGCAVDTINMAAVRIYHRCAELLSSRGKRMFYDCAILLQVHDELVIMCRDEDANDIARIFKEEAERPIVVNGDLLSIPVDLAIGKRWCKNHLTPWEG